MKLEGSHKIAASKAAVWRALTDPTILQRSIPGCEKLEATGEHTYKATLKAGVGNIQGKFAGEVSLTDMVDEKSFTLTSRAKSPVGFVEGKGKVALEGSGKETTVKFSGEVKPGGMLAAVGGRLIEAAAKKNLEEMFENLAREAKKL